MKTLAHQPPLQVGEGCHHRIDPSFGDFSLELLEGQVPGHDRCSCEVRSSAGLRPAEKRLGLALRLMGKSKLFLARQDELVPAHQCEIQNPYSKPNTNPENTFGEVCILPLEDKSDRSDNDCDRSPRNANRTDIWPDDIWVIDSKQNERNGLQNV